VIGDFEPEVEVVPLVAVVDALLAPPVVGLLLGDFEELHAPTISMRAPTEAAITTQRVRDLLDDIPGLPLLKRRSTWLACPALWVEHFYLERHPCAA
jgi:hypothetical protein